MLTRPDTPTAPTRRRPTGLRLRNVELFASGQYRGKEYTVADLDEMAANGRKLGPQGLRLLDPTAVLGHEETQRYLELTDLPAAGWVTNLRVKKYHEPATGRTEAILIGDIEGVPPPIANRIRSGQYRKVSAEVYTDFTDDFGRSFGKALRRVALLGAEVPQVKRIADLPLPETYADRPRRRHLTPLAAVPTGRGTYLCFAESPGMNRSQMIQALMAAMPGLTPATLDGMTDDQLADLAKNVTPAQPVTAADATAGLGLPPTPTPFPTGDMGMNPMQVGQQPMQYADDPAAMTREELIAELTAAGQDAAALQGMSDDDLKKLYATQVAGGGTAAMGDPATMTREELIAELTGLGEDSEELAEMTDDELKQLYASLTSGDAPAVAGADAAAAAMSERRVAGLHAYAERVAQHNAAVVTRQAKRLQRQDAVLFCEGLVKAGKLLPAQKPTVLRTLLNADHLNPTAVFSDGKRTVRVTPYEALKREYQRWPEVVKFGERVAGDDRGAVEAYSEDRELGILRRFAEANPAAVQAGYGSVEKFTEKFHALKKKKHNLTARDVIGAEAERYAG